jgi:ornithine cyclodeaminase/alanine dehydrogenase-like protein (mu-crystallin family)
MSLLLDENDVRAVMRAPDAMLELIERVEAALGVSAASASRLVLDHPPGSVGEHAGRSLRLLPSLAPELGGAAVRVYTTLKDDDRGRPAPSELLLLFDAETMELKSLIEDYSLHALRTAAPTGVAVRGLTRDEPLDVGVVGTGRQARGQLAAVASVRRLARVRAFSRSATAVAEFCTEMSELLEFEVEPATTAKAAVCDAELVLVATSAGGPAVARGWLSDTAVVVSIAAGELDERIIVDATLVPCSRAEVLGGTPRWTPVPELVAAGRLDPHLGPELADAIRDGHASRGLTVFLSTGMALWDLVAAVWVDERARQLGLGRTLWDGARTGIGFMTPLPSRRKVVP